MKKLIMAYLLLVSVLSAYEIKTELNFDYNLIEDKEKTSAVGADLILEENLDKYDIMMEYKITDSKNYLDLAKIRQSFEKYDIELGRQRFGWGVGFSFNPIDVFNPTDLGSGFSSTYTKRGRDGILYRRYFESSSLECIYTFENSEFGEDYGIKYRDNIKDYDIELVIINKGKRAYEDSDKIVGGTLRGSIPIMDIGLWCEGAYYTDKKSADISLGGDLYFKEIYYFNLEYYKNYLGESDKKDYNLSYLDSGILMGRDYLIPSLNTEINEKMTNNIYAFINLNDNSAMIGDDFIYRYDDNIDVEFNPYAYVGDKNSEFDYVKMLSHYGMNIKMRLIF